MMDHWPIIITECIASVKYLGARKMSLVIQKSLK